MTFEQAIETIKAGIWSLSWWSFRDRDKVVIRTDDDGDGNEVQVAIELDGGNYAIEKVPGGFEVQIFIPCYSYQDGDGGDVATVDTFADLAKAVECLLMLPARFELEGFFEATAIDLEIAEDLESVGGP